MYEDSYACTHARIHTHTPAPHTHTHIYTHTPAPHMYEDAHARTRMQVHLNNTHTHTLSSTNDIIFGHWGKSINVKQPLVLNSCLRLKIC